VIFGITSIALFTLLYLLFSGISFSHSNGSFTEGNRLLLADNAKNPPKRILKAQFPFAPSNSFAKKEEASKRILDAPIPDPYAEYWV